MDCFSQSRQSRNGVVVFDADFGDPDFAAFFRVTTADGDQTDASRGALDIKINDPVIDHSVAGITEVHRGQDRPITQVEFTELDWIKNRWQLISLKTDSPQSTEKNLQKPSAFGSESKLFAQRF